MDEIIDYVMETPGNTNPNVLRGMLNNNGGNLPAVTSADNGDVLTVVSGEWAKAAPSGGALLVGLTVNETTITCDKTAGEIWTAFTGGRTIVFAVPNGAAYTILLAKAEPDYNFVVWNGDGALTFNAASADDYPSAELD